MNDLKVPEAKTVGGNPSRANWAKAFAKMASRGAMPGGATPENPGAGMSAAYNPAGVKTMGAETMSRIADATRSIAGAISGLGDDRPQVMQATGQIFEIKAPQSGLNGVEKVSKVPTNAFDTIDRLAKQIDTELFTDETVTGDEMATSFVSELEGLYEEFDKLALEQVKPIFQEQNYDYVFTVKYKIGDEILPKLEKLTRRVEGADFGGCQNCKITQNDILVRIERLQEYAEAILEGVVNKEAEIKQQRDLNKIASGDCSPACDSCQSC